MCALLGWNVYCNKIIISNVAPPHLQPQHSMVCDDLAVGPLIFCLCMHRYQCNAYPPANIWTVILFVKIHPEYLISIIVHVWIGCCYHKVYRIFQNITPLMDLQCLSPILDIVVMWAVISHGLYSGIVAMMQHSTWPDEPCMTFMLLLEIILYTIWCCRKAVQYNMHKSDLELLVLKPE